MGYTIALLPIDSSQPLYMVPLTFKSLVGAIFPNSSGLLIEVSFFRISLDLMVTASTIPGAVLSATTLFELSAGPSEPKRRPWWSFCSNGWPTWPSEHFAIACRISLSGIFPVSISLSLLSLSSSPESLGMCGRLGGGLLGGDSERFLGVRSRSPHSGFSNGVFLCLPWRRAFLLLSDSEATSESLSDDDDEDDEVYECRLL